MFGGLGGLTQCLTLSQFPQTFLTNPLNLIQHSPVPNSYCVHRNVDRGNHPWIKINQRMKWRLCVYNATLQHDSGKLVTNNFVISYSLFADCRSLFLRHVQSGRCITTGSTYAYPKKHYAKPVFVVMTDNCLDVKAQFRYLDSELLYNIETGGTFFANANYNNRLVVYEGVSKGGISSQNNKNNFLKQTADGTLFFYKISVCAEPSKSSTPTFVDRKTSCGGTPAQNFTFGKWS